MSNLIKILTIMMVLNIFMYLAVNFSISADEGFSLNKDYNFHFKGDLMDSVLGGSANINAIAQSAKDNWTNYGLELNGSFNSIPDQQGGISTGTGGINFLDSLKIVWSFVLTIGNVITAPLTLFFNFRLPVLIGFMIGIPYFFILVLCLFAFIRGVSD